MTIAASTSTPTVTTTEKKRKVCTGASIAGSFRISKIIRKRWLDWSFDRQRIFYWELTNPSPYDDHEDWDEKPYWRNSYLRSVLPWSEQESTMEYETWVAYFDGCHIGWAVVEWRTEHQGMLHVFVKKEYRRLGVGRNLIARVSEDCKDKRLRAYHWDNASREFYLGAKRENSGTDLVVVKEKL